MDWQNKRVVVAGRFARRTQHELERELRDAGAKVSGRLSGQTDYLIAGSASGSKLSVAWTLNTPVIDEQQYEALRRGEPVDPSKSRHAKGNAPKGPSIASNDALERLRMLLHGALNTEAWGNVCQVLDLCDEDTLEIAVDYVQNATKERHGTYLTPALFTAQGFSRGNVHWYDLHQRLTPQCDPCFMPLTWQKELLAGHQSIKYRAVTTFGINHGTRFNATLSKHLTQSPHFEQIKHLYLGRYKLGKRFWRQLATSDAYPNATFLDLSLTDIDNDMLDGILQSPQWAGLKGLDLSEIYLEQLPQRLPTGLKTLSLSLNLLYRHADALAEVFDGVQLRELSLNSNGMTQEHLATFLKKPIDGLKTLETLSLRHNPLHDAGIKVLAAATWMDQLRLLDLQHTTMRTEGAVFLANAPHLASLETLLLDIDPKMIGARGQWALLRSPHLSETVKEGLKTRWHTLYSEPNAPKSASQGTSTHRSAPQENDNTPRDTAPPGTGGVLQRLAQAWKRFTGSTDR